MVAGPTPSRPFLVPSPALRPYVERIWELAAPAGAILPLLLPGTGAELVLHAGTPFAVADGGRRRRLPPAHLIASRSGARQLLSDGPVELVALRFRTGALRHLLQVPLAEVEDRFASAEEAFGSDGARLLAQAVELPGLAARARHLERVLLGLLRRCGTGPDPADRVLARLHDRAGHERVGEAAAALGTSRRQLERTVRAAFGRGPKHLQRLARFHHVVRGLLLAGSADYLGPALDLGFCDQAHFIHEVGDLTGRTPGKLLTPAAFASHFYNPPLRLPGHPPSYEREEHRGDQDDGCAQQ